MTIMRLRNILPIAAVAVMLSLLAGACSKGKSYSELLSDEGRACNWYLAKQKVENRIPKDSIFIEGKDAPFYKMDKDGYLYMQVVNSGDKKNRPEVGDQIYFRFMRRNLKEMWKGNEVVAEGNADNLGTTGLGPTSFIYGNLSLETTSRYGTGIQVPLAYLGNNCEVNLVLQSYYGFSIDKSECIPYVINVRYFKAEY